ncbi:MAG: hypothetical protein CMM90_05090 [Rickettsiales bacterium]|nr:hypothetical protein [Rickettsiales bacterium]
MSKSMWIISVLILIMMISSFWFARDREAPPWVKCKESLFTQVVFKKCTPSSFATPRLSNEGDQIEQNLDELPYEPPQN